MNRAQKRMLQRQGALGADGEPARQPAQQRKAPAAQTRTEAKEGRTSPATFLKEVRAELRKVAWPTRDETINYSIIVLVAIVVMTTFIALVDIGISEFVLRIFDE